MNLSDSPTAILAVGVSLLGVGALTILAGVNDGWGTVVNVFMVGLWLVYLTTHGSFGHLALSKMQTTTAPPIPYYQPPPMKGVKP